VNILAVDDHIPHIDADAKIDAPILRQLRIVRGERLLGLDGGMHRVDNTGKFD